MTTDKKDKILQAALQLFAQHGYSATSTSKIAKAAGVSEGLIFRHFSNKQGLLDALYAELEGRLQAVMAPMLFEMDAKEVLHKFITVARAVPKSDYPFWRLQFILKWQPEYNRPEKMKPIKEKLRWAFTELGYDEPAMETQMLVMLNDQLAKAYLLETIENGEAYEAFLLKKYNL